jgi:hypothetical protein
MTLSLGLLLSFGLPLSLGPGVFAPAPRGQDPHDPRTMPTRARHALFVLDGVPHSRVQALGDLDGDGVEELLAQRRSELVYFGGGTGVQRGVLSEVAVMAGGGEGMLGAHWAVGPDLDGDAVREVAFFAGRGDERELRVVSGRTGRTVFAEVTGGSWAPALAWYGDADGDAVHDLAAVSSREGLLVTWSGATRERLWTIDLPEDRYHSAHLQDMGDRDGDGHADLLLRLGSQTQARISWISGRTGKALVDPPDGNGPFTPLGDLDGDGLGDVAVGGGSSAIDFVPISIRTTSGQHPWRDIPLHMFPSVRLCVIGDIDGDGTPDIAVGDSEHHLPGPEEAGPNTPAVSLDGLTLRQALSIWPSPCNMSSESGIVRVHSGATGEVLLAIFGEPGTHGGVGSTIWPVADQSGDGVADIAVNTEAGGMAVYATRPVHSTFSADPFIWLPGRWVAETKRGDVEHVSEELWLPPAGGRMLGVNQRYRRGVNTAGTFEFLRLERDGDVVSYVAQPGGSPPTRFRATELRPWTALFTNPAHDFPTQIRYTREFDVLRAEVGTADEPARLRFEWRRSE